MFNNDGTKPQKCIEEAYEEDTTETWSEKTEGTCLSEATWTDRVTKRRTAGKAGKSKGKSFNWTFKVYETQG